MKRLLASIIICLPILSGCYDMKEVSDELYAIVLAVDKSDEGITLSVAVPQYGSLEENETKVYSSNATDMSEGLDSLNRLLSRKISLLHLKTVIFSEELAKEGLLDHAGTIQKHLETRNAMGVMISKSRADEMVKALSDRASGNISSEVELLMLTRRYDSFYPTVLFEDFYNNMKSGYRSAYAVYGDVGEDIACGIAMFKDDVMTGVLNREEAAFFMIADGKLKGGGIPFETGDGTVFADIECKKSDIKADSGVEINLSLEARLENDSSEDLSNDIKIQINNGVRGMLRKAAACGCDILGINGYAARNYFHIQSWERQTPDFENIIVKSELELTKGVNG